MIDRERFFPTVRAALFGGRLTQSQVDGLNAILAAAPAGMDRRWLAYALATTHHETDRTMRPIEEYGKGRGRPYGAADPETGWAYYGRGYVQLTWKENYRRMQDLLGHALVDQPDLALRPEIAAAILFKGMTLGSFTGRKFADYFNAAKTDWLNARRIINGMDRAAAIAGHAEKYFLALGGPD
jgi:putative chitinase